MSSPTTPFQAAAPRLWSAQLWPFALSAVSWLFLANYAAPSVHDHHTAAASGFPGAALAGLPRWLIMVVAMMSPLVADTCRSVADRSLLHRRHRAIAGFLTGFVGCWFFVSAPAFVAAAFWRIHAGDDSRVPAAAFVVAAIWQFVPARVRARHASHRTAVLAPNGWAADRDCVRYGLETGGHCVVTCWAMMAGCLLAPHSLVAMSSITAFAIAERRITRVGPALTAAAFLAISIIQIAH